LCISGETYSRNEINLFLKKQAGIGYIEEIDGKLYAFEFKWKPEAKVNFPKASLKIIAV